MSTYIQEIRQALAVTVTDEDIKALVDTTRKKALHNASIAAELKTLPENNGKALLSIKHCYSLYQLWRIILLGSSSNEKEATHVLPFISLNNSIHWLRIIFNTLDNHFSGEIAEVGKINALHYFNLFINDGAEEQAPTDNSHNNSSYTITCAAQMLLCSSLALNWINSTPFFLT
ncbi:hypothetical protein [Botryobacter ruber]|uniref:hypothetical protein n=1 Tax=Botryobacter ruber TaxID=2171629 RepID=UPI000F6464C9|nr:hypothetical protein [Botryobacter ruber]